MLLPFFAAVSAFATPSVDINVAQAVSRNMPNWVYRQRKWTAAELELFADPKGKVLNCEVRRFVDYEAVAQQMCEILIGRRIKPAKNFEGEQAYGLGRVVSVVTNGSSTELLSRLGRMQQEGMILTVNRIPENAEGESVPRFPLGLEVDTNGDVTRCDGLTDLPEAFLVVACVQSKAKEFEVRIGPDGSAVPYVRRFEIVFELASQ